MMVHLESAGAGARAIPWILAAAEENAEAADTREAHRLAEKGLALGARPVDEGHLHRFVASHHVENNDLAGALRSGRFALERLPTTDPHWFSAASLVIYSSSAVGDLASGAEVIGRWLAESVRPDGTNNACAAQFLILLGLLTAGMTDQAKAVLARAALPRRGTLGEAWIELSNATIPAFQSGRLGEALIRARCARDIALRHGGVAAIGAANAFIFPCKMSLSGEVLAEVNDAVQSFANADSPAALTLKVYRAYLEAIADPERLSALRRCASVPNAMAAQIAQSYLELELLRRNRIEELEAELAEHSPVLAFGRTSAAVLTAFVTLWHGEPERTHRELAEAEALARVAASYWTWELLHACRASAYLALGRKVDAVASVRAGLARIEYTLEGIDDELRAGAEVHVDAIKRLRALAKDLGVTDAGTA